MALENSGVIARSKNGSFRRAVDLQELDIQKAFTTADHMHLTVSELPDEITQFIFSFISSSELMRATQVCSAWRRVGSDDSFWRDKYLLERVCDNPAETVPISGYRNELITLVKNRKQLVELNIEYDKHNHNSSRVEICSAGFVTCLLLIGFLVYSIMFVLFLENSVPDTPRNHSLMLIPFVCLFGVPFLVCAGCFQLIRKVFHWKWFKCADQMRQMDASSSEKYSYVQSRQILGELVFLMMGYLGAIPFAGTAAYVKLVFDLRRVPWKYTFSPYYFYSALYLILPPILLCWGGMRWTKIKDRKECLISSSPY